MRRWAVIAVAAALLPCAGQCQSAANMAALRGLAPFSALGGSQAGKSALAANFSVTGGIQTGALQQPTLLPFAQQQQQALRDAFITNWNAAALADGLGTTLGAAYLARASYQDREHFTNVSPAIANLIAYTNETTAADSGAGKYFFANLTTDGHAPVSAAAADILSKAGGTTDVFGIAYGLKAGSGGADPFGNSRPFQTEHGLIKFSGLDYFGKPASNMDYLKGPAADLTQSPSFPSGHTTYGYSQAVLLGILVPPRYQQEIVRGAEYGNDRIILGAHYAMDVIAGRALALYDLAHLLANDPNYVGQPRQHSAPIGDYRAAVQAAQAELASALQAGCGAALAACAANDTGRFSNAGQNEKFYGVTQTYDLPVIHGDLTQSTEDVEKIAPEAGYLLTVAFPKLSLAAADKILTSTEGPGGGFLDDGSAFGLYSRLDLLAAAGQAAMAR